MRVYISADIEGITGVVSGQLQTNDQGKDYERARRLMTGDVNAAIAGAFDAGATYVLVSDGHGASRMRNIILEDLDPRAEAIVGTPRSLGQMEGINDTFDVVFFVGYHSRMGSDGILSHTISGGVVANVWINGVAVGESGINASIAAGFGVPVGLVTGDQHVAQEAREIMPWVDTVMVKQAISRESARCLSPQRTAKMIREAAAECVRKASQKAYSPLGFGQPLTYTFQANNSGLADAAARMHEITRVNPTTFKFSAPDGVTGYRVLRALIGLAQ